MQESHEEVDDGHGAVVVPFGRTPPHRPLPWAELLDANIEQVWWLAHRWCPDVGQAERAFEMTWLRVAERLSVWLSGIDDSSINVRLVRDLVLGTAVEECLRERRRNEWREQVGHAQGA